MASSEEHDDLLRRYYRALCTLFVNAPAGDPALEADVIAARERLENARGPIDRSVAYQERARLKRLRNGDHRTWLKILAGVVVRCHPRFFDALKRFSPFTDEDTIFVLTEDVDGKRTYRGEAELPFGREGAVHWEGWSLKLDNGDWAFSLRTSMCRDSGRPDAWTL